MAEEVKAAAAPEEPGQPKMVNGVPAWDGKLMLRKKIVANGEETDQITFREPTAGDIAAVGNPVSITWDVNNIPRLHFDGMLMTAMMSRLAAVPPSTIRNMHTKDWNNGAYLLANFFVPDL